MDPISSSVNVITLLATGVKSAQLLCKFVGGFRDASADVARYHRLLQGLTSTFATLQTLLCESESAFELSDGFVRQLSSCLEDLKTAQARIQDHDVSGAGNGLGRSWRRLKWSTSSENWLQAFMNRLQMYYAAFALELGCLQLNIQTSVENLLTVKESAALTTAAREAPTIDSSPNTPLTPWYPTPVSVYHRKGWIYDILLYSRSTYRKPWKPGEDMSIPAQQYLSGQSHSIQLSLTLPFSRFLNVKYSILRSIRALMSLSARFDVSFPRMVDWDALIMHHARTGDIGCMEQLFSAARASPFDRLPDGTSLLHIAAARGYVEMVKFLIFHGADVDAADRDGDTPLHSASRGGRNYEVARTLLQHGSDLGIQNAAGRVPIQCTPNEVTRHILQVYDGPVDLSCQDHDGKTIAHYLSNSNSTSPRELQHVLKSDFSCLTIKDVLGRIPLHYTVMRGNSATSSYLLELSQHSNENLTTPQGTTLLHFATQSKRIEVMDLVLPYCEGIFARNDEGRSVVHAAVWADNVAAIRKVIEMGGSALLHRPDIANETPRQLAARVGAEKVLEYFDSECIGHEPSIPLFAKRPYRQVQREKEAETLITYAKKTFGSNFPLFRLCDYIIPTLLFVIAVGIFVHWSARIWSAPNTL